jgi:hypothetical protein
VWERSYRNIVDEYRRGRLQGRVVVLVKEDQHRTSGASEGLHTYGVLTSFGLQSSRAAEEDGFGLEIWQCNSIQHVEFPLTQWYSSKQGTKQGRREE